MTLDALNFAQPLWLWGLLLIPVGLLCCRYSYKFIKKDLSPLENFADKQLLPHLLISAEQTKKQMACKFGFMLH